MAKILIAEDEHDIRELIVFTLNYGGYDVFAAANGVKCLELVPTVNPDLIIMDVRMPLMTGYEACRVLKNSQETRDIPVVFLSAKGQEEEILAGLNAGAYEYILKPFAPDELLMCLERILHKYEKNKL